MSARALHIVTGAYGYTGRYIARRLLDAGHRVRTLTNSPGRENPFGDAVEAVPYSFDHPEILEENLRGAAVLYNTYWVRFNHKTFRFEDAVRNTITLFDAARRAGVERIVHVSITNPSEDSELEYFSGKARLERELSQSGLSHAILRPAVVFGKQDILINNIAWVLRRLPVFGVFGDGRYRLEPIHVDDLAALAVEQGRSKENVTIDAIGPEAFTFRSLVETIGQAIGKRRPILPTPPAVAHGIAWLAGWFVGDTIITRDEIAGLMQGRLYTGSQPAGRTALSEWTARHAADLGRSYASELARRRDRSSSYDDL